MKKMIFVLLLIPVFAYPLDKDQFIELLVESSMKFIHPYDFDTIPAKKNPDVLYQYAVKHKSKKIEIRYSIWPLKKDIEEYKKSLKDPDVVLVDPNKSYMAFTAAVVMNISHSEKTLGINEFKPNDVKKEFNADWGASYFITCNSEFGKGYKYAMVVALHKDNIANAYIIFLFDNFKEIQKEMLYSFYSLQFE